MCLYILWLWTICVDEGNYKAKHFSYASNMKSQQDVPQQSLCSVWATGLMLGNSKHKTAP